MAQKEKMLPKCNMMQLEEVNRATSPEEYRQKYDQWMRDRGFPVEDQIFSFVQVMQYCERLEEQSRKHLEIYQRYMKVLDCVDELVKSPLKQLLYACFVRIGWLR